MAALTRRVAVLGLLLAAPVRADPVDRWQAMIEQASIRFGVPARWIAQVIRTESGGVTSLQGHPIRSRAGAIGLMQLMPATWTMMRARLGLGADPDDPHDNIQAGTFYLRLLYDRFGYPGLFVAYNAGPAAYARHLAGAPLPAETRAYLAKVGVALPARAGGAAGAIGSAWRTETPPLFAIRHDGGEKAGAGDVARQSLFALRGATP